MELSLQEMVFIVFVALLLYGGRLPKVALALGRAIGEFKKGLRETSDLVRYEVEESERSAWDVRRLAEPADAALATEDLSSSAADPVPDPSADRSG